MSEDLNTLAERSNIVHALEPGFISCTADDKSLYFAFDSALNAEQFKFKRELEGSAFPMIVDGSTVIETRS
jgi:hypothetical protein